MKTQSMLNLALVVASLTASASLLATPIQIHLSCRVKQACSREADIGCIRSVVLRGASVETAVMTITRTEPGDSRNVNLVLPASELEFPSADRDSIHVWYGDSDTGLSVVSRDGGRTFSGDPETAGAAGSGLTFEEDFAFAVTCVNRAFARDQRPGVER